MKTRVAIFGAGGRMGRALVASAFNEKTAIGIQLAAAVVSPDSALLGIDIGTVVLGKPVGVACIADLVSVAGTFDVLIDFTTSQASVSTLNFCQQHHKALVLGTTGFTEAQQHQIKHAAQHIPIVYAPNMSIGVNLLLGLVGRISAALSGRADIEVIEAHHKHKKDAPSGTALAIGEAIAQAQGTNLQERAVYTRHGPDIGVRKADSIGFSTIRAGNIVGEHTALFALQHERLEITHKASSRSAFADGALYAAHWLAQHQHTQGLFSMQQVLGF